MNVFRDDWGEVDDWSGGGAKSTRLVSPGVQLGASVYELAPGNTSAYHFHHGSEELLIVLRGRPTLRSPDGERQLAEGEVVHFAIGPEGAHGMRNDTDEPVRYVVAGIRVSPEVAEYPDTKQLTAQARTESQTGERLWFVHDLA
ncbi:MAG: cupin domain-containing protein [Gaiellaceae bacterium]